MRKKTKSKTFEEMEKEVTILIESVKNPEKRAMLRSVYWNNARYAKTTEDVEKLRKIIGAMDAIDRRFFMNPDYSAFCYEDSAQPIGYGQTISQPSTVARMLYLLDMNKGCKILEIGTGSGWNAALVAWLVKPSKIITAERIPELTEFAKSNFKELIKSEKLKLNLEFVCGNAFDGKSKIWKQKYDRIIVTAGASSELSIQLENLAKALLKEKGLLLYPTSGDWGALELLQFEHKKLKKICSESGYVFVPLIKK